MQRVGGKPLLRRLAHEKLVFAFPPDNRGSRTVPTVIQLDGWLSAEMPQFLLGGELGQELGVCAGELIM